MNLNTAKDIKPELFSEKEQTIMQTNQERDERENPDHEQESPNQPTEPSRDEMRGLLCKPSDRNPPREKFRGIMI